MKLKIKQKKPERRADERPTNWSAKHEITRRLTARHICAALDKY